MGIFQKSVINSHFANLDKEQVDRAFDKFKENYSPKKIAEIKNLKEEEYQDGFLREIFVEVFGYTLKPAENYNLAREFKNQTDGKKADGAILKDEKAIVVIELKSTKTKDLKSITEQAFNYKNNQHDCKYVITSNFQKLRFYIDYANEYEEFDLFNLQKEEFELLYLILHKNGIFADLPLKLKNETKFHEDNISDKLYKDYSNFKHKIYANLIKNNLQYDKLTLFKKSQKFLDRLLFVFFAEDTGLVPPNAISKIVEQWETLKELDEYKTLYSRFVKFFEHLDKGHKYKTYELPAYNGGLFAPDEILDNITIDDEILKDDALKLSAYDFNTDVDVNILGHIFEHSLGEIEEITAEIEGTATEKEKSRRKKDGVFYTPKYITQYIVENTIGMLCTEKRKELNITEIEFDGTYKTKDGKLSAKGKKLFKTLEEYKNWLLTLKIIDPACGSGAFLNQALSFLIEEHKHIDDILAELTGEALRLFDTDKAILENNLYGVDINEESVEIARLSLWLRTAKKGRKLSNLNANIKCGNSLIDDPEIAGDKAFDWHTEFPQVFEEKKKKAWHITTATHNSRYSQRMFDNHVKLGEAEWIDKEDETVITKTIAEIVKESKLDNNGLQPIEILEYNLCGDHMHLLLVCEEEEVEKIVGKIKAISSKERNIAKGYTTRGHAPLSADLAAERGETQTKLWTQKFGKSEIRDENYLNNAIEYILNNRIKHQLPENKEIEKIKKEFLTIKEQAFRTEYKGGFDCVIGNPPWGAKLNINDTKFLVKKYSNIPSKIKDTYLYFTVLAINIIKSNGILGFIIPNTWLLINNANKFRRFILQYNILNITDHGDAVFKDAIVESTTIILEKQKITQQKCETIREKFGKLISRNLVDKKIWLSDDLNRIVIDINLDFVSLLNKIEKISDKFENNCEIIFGIKPYQVGHGIPKQTREDVNNRIYHSVNKEDASWFPLITGTDVNRYSMTFNNNAYIKYGQWLMYSSNHRKINSPKLLLRRTSADLRFTYDNENYYPQNSLFIITSTKYELKFLMAILNSSLFAYLYKNKIPQKGKVFAEVKPSIIKSLPIKQTSSNIFEKKANKMLDLNKTLQQKRTKFLNRLTDNLFTKGACPLDELKLSKKLEVFYNYDFKTLLSELKKKKIKLSLIQQDEWEEYFNAYKTEINNLQNQINQTDKEIDQMVYKLYELTDEEVAIVKKSINTM